MPAVVLIAGLSPKQDYDLLIRNGRVLDGTGNPWTKQDIAVRGDTIVAVGQLQHKSAKQTIDVAGLYVAPGFIDVHTHAGEGLTDRALSAARPLLAQGITSVIINPDGGGSIDLKKQQRALLEHGLGVNVAQMVPHGSIRREVIGLDDRPAEADELQQMRNLVQKGMEAGAVGLSTGLFYPPAGYAETEEIIELAKIAARYNGIHQSHIRDESDYTIGVLASVDEIIEISRQSGIPGIVTHVKVLGPNVWGQSGRIVEKIDRARDEEGLEIFTDQYPYEASATGLSAALVPQWAASGGRDRFLERLEDEEIYPRIVAGMKENLARRGGADRLMIRRFVENPSLEGKLLSDIAEEQNMNDVETALWLLRQGSPGIVSFNMHPDDVEWFMKQPWNMTSSDGGLVKKGEGVPHPRNYGAFPRKIRLYVKEKNVIDLSYAIRSMTSLSATVYRLPDKGLIRPGQSADLVVFNLQELKDKATYTEPHQLSEGMIHVIVNGIFAVRDGEFTGELPGRILGRRDF